MHMSATRKFEILPVLPFKGFILLRLTVSGYEFNDHKYTKLLCYMQ